MPLVVRERRRQWEGETVGNLVNQSKPSVSLILSQSIRQFFTSLLDWNSRHYSMIVKNWKQKWRLKKDGDKDETNENCSGGNKSSTFGAA